MVFLFLVLLSVLYFSTSQSLYELWFKSGNPAYSHGSIAVLIAAYIFLKYWFVEKSEMQIPGLHMPGFLALILVSLMWFLSALGGIQVLQQLLYLGIVAALFWALFGSRVLKHLAIPLLIVLTAIPVWDFLNHYLQIATAVNVEFMLHLTGIPFVREGTNILLPSGTFQIEERCSGLRMFVAMVAIALLCIYQWRLRWQVGIVFMLASLVLAIIINSIRIYIVVIAGYLTDMQHYFVTTDHVTLGWVLFGAVLFIYLMLCNRYLLSDRWYVKVVRQTSNNEKLSENVTATQGNKKDSWRPAALLLILAGISIGPVLASVYQTHLQNDANVSIEIASPDAEWVSLDRVGGDWQPVYHGADYQWQKMYQDRKNNVVELYLAYYAFQSEGKEAIHHLNELYDKERWKTVSQRTLDKRLSAAPVEVNQYIIESRSGGKRLVWQWYFINNQRIVSRLDAKVAGIKGLLFGDPAISVLAISTNINQDYEKADAVLTAFLGTFIKGIEDAVERATVTADEHQ